MLSFIQAPINFLISLVVGQKTTLAKVRSLVKTEAELMAVLYGEDQQFEAAFNDHMYTNNPEWSAYLTERDHFNVHKSQDSEYCVRCATFENNDAPKALPVYEIGCDSSCACGGSSDV